MGMPVRIYALAPERRLLAQAAIGASGALDHPIVAQRLVPGPYEVVFGFAAYFAAVGAAPSQPPFIDEAPFRFTTTDPEQHIHLPIKFTAWGYSLFRGS